MTSTIRVVGLAAAFTLLACGKSGDGGDEQKAPSPTPVAAKPDKPAPRITPFNPEYGPRFIAFMNAMIPVAETNKGKCEAMATAAATVVEEHAATIELMRDSNSAAAREWRKANAPLVKKFGAAMKHMLACRSNTEIVRLLARMRGN